MNLSEFKQQFEAAVSASEGPASIEAVWLAFNASLSSLLDDETCEEFGFSAGWAAHQEASRPVEDRSRFQIYFGRLIDLSSQGRQRTVEINVYYRYLMTAELQAWMDDRLAFDREAAFCLADGKDVIGQKLAAFFDFVDRQQRLWETVRGFAPESRDIQFYTW